MDDRSDLDGVFRRKFFLQNVSLFLCSSTVVFFLLGSGASKVYV